jgi:predicted nucleotidyltransferase
MGRVLINSINNRNFNNRYYIIIMNNQLNLPHDRIKNFCQKHYISKLSIFGSVLTDNYNSKSDLDILVNFKPDHIPGLNFFYMEEELSKLLGVKVDLNTPAFLSRYFRDEVIKNAKVEYDEG